MLSGWSRSRTEPKSLLHTTLPSLHPTNPRDLDVSCWLCPSSAGPQLRVCRPCSSDPSSATFHSSTSSQLYEVFITRELRTKRCDLHRLPLKIAVSQNKKKSVFLSSTHRVSKVNAQSGWIFWQLITLYFISKITSRISTNFGSDPDTKICHVNLIVFGPIHITKISVKNLKARELMEGQY